jgi:hypothetical protein
VFVSLILKRLLLIEYDPHAILLNLDLDLLHIPRTDLNQTLALDLVPAFTPLLPVLLLTCLAAAVYSQAKTALEGSFSSSKALASQLSQDDQ